MAKQLNAYMAFDRHQGSEEAAMLVFASTAQEARKLSFGRGWCEWTEWVDWKATKIKDLPQHLEALREQGPVIECPPTCPECDLWSGHMIEGKGCSICCGVTL